MQKPGTIHEPKYLIQLHMRSVDLCKEDLERSTQFTNESERLEQNKSNKDEEKKKGSPATGSIISPLSVLVIQLLSSFEYLPRPTID